MSQDACQYCAILELGPIPPPVAAAQVARLESTLAKEWSRWVREDAIALGTAAREIAVASRELQDSSRALRAKVLQTRRHAAQLRPAILSAGRAEASVPPDDVRPVR